MSKSIADITKGMFQNDEEIKRDIDEIAGKLIDTINKMGGNDK